MKGSVKIIPQSVLAVSEPPPEWFGNACNEKGNPNWTNGNWLKSRFHFSFAEYNNPRNMVSIVNILLAQLVNARRHTLTYTAYCILTASFYVYTFRDMEF